MLALQDVRFGFRMLARRPAFTLVALLVLAIGIGANATVFTLVDSILLEPLGYPDADRLVQVWEHNRHTGERSWVYYGNYVDWRAQATSFEDLAIYNLWEQNVWGDPEPERVKTCWVTASYFRILGARPLLGRTFVEAEEAPGNDGVAVISHSLWQRRFGGDPAVVGKELVIGEATAAIVGVMPPTFRHPGPPALDQPELWFPNVVWTGREDRRSGYTWERVIGRLAAGATPAVAQREMDTIADRLARDHPATNAQRGVLVVPLTDHVVGDLRTELEVLMLAVGLVLLLVCANVSSLVTVRSASRRQELAVRMALGAPRRRLVAQLAVESAFLAVAGAALGLALASLASAALTGTGWDLPRLDDVALDASTVVFASATALVGVLLFGLLPAAGALRGALHPSLKAGARGTAGGQQALQRTLVVSEVALALALVVGAGLLARSYRQILADDPGFRPERAVTADLSQDGARYRDPAQRVRFWDELLDRMAAQPGVSAVGGVTLPPLQTHDDAPTIYQVEGREPPPPGQEPTAELVIVSPGYVEAMGLTVVEGRAFDVGDRADSGGVAILNRSLADRLWPGGSAVGKRLRLPDRTGTWWQDQPDTDWLTVVGVVADVRLFGLDTEPVAEIYRPFAQDPWIGMTLVVRGSLPADAVGRMIRREARAIDPNQPVRGLTTMAAVYDRSLERRRTLLGVLVGFAVVALALAGLGLYGVMAWSVAQRTREIGVRMAIGARAADILRLVLAQSGRLIAAGIAIGLVLAGLLTRLLAGLLFEVAGFDPMTWLLAILVLAGSALLAAFVPARRATRVDPLVALRHD